MKKFLENISKNSRNFLNKYLSNWVRRGIALFAVASILGTIFDPNGYWINILAGLGSVGIAFVLGQSFLNDYEQKKWSKVREIAITSLVIKLIFIFQEILEAFKKLYPDRFANVPKNVFLPDKMTDLLVLYLPEIKQILDSAEDDFVYQLELNKDFILYEVTDILSDITPQLIQSSATQEILNALYQLKQKRVTLESILGKHVVYQPNYSLSFIINIFSKLWFLSNKELNKAIFL